MIHSTVTKLNILLDILNFDLLNLLLIEKIPKTQINFLTFEGGQSKGLLT